MHVASSVARAYSWFSSKSDARAGCDMLYEYTTRWSGPDCRV